MTAATYTDKLIVHLNTCPQCKRARGWERRGSRCAVAKELLKQTLKERHG